MRICLKTLDYNTYVETELHALLNICIFILPMLRPNYSTVEHVNALIKMLTPTLVTRDTRFTLKEVFLFSCRKTIFLSLFMLICLKTLDYNTYVETQLEHY